jgi:D-alanyl-D-alanine carboxypeptidase
MFNKSKPKRGTLTHFKAYSGFVNSQNRKNTAFSKLTHNYTFAKYVSDL